MTGTPVYFREKHFQILGTPVKTCLKVTGTPVKTCRNFGSRNDFKLDLLRLWLQPLILPCNTLQHTATHCNTLQHTATLCNTLQHTATHCNTLIFLVLFLEENKTLPLSCHLYHFRLLLRFFSFLKTHT